MKKSTLLFFIFVASIIQIHAQEIYRSIIDRVASTNYIFEGVVIKTQPYETHDEKTIYTSNIIQVTKIFKGNLSCGTIEMITNGGELDEKGMHCSHCLELKEGEQGIFLCENTDRELPDSSFYPVTIGDVMEPKFEWQSFIKYEGDSLLHAYDLYQEFQQLSEVYDLMEIATQLTYIDCANQGGELRRPNPVHPVATPAQPMPHYNKADYDKIMDYADMKRAHYTRNAPINRSASTITYNLANVIVTGTTNKYVEFDVTVKDDIGTKYLDQSAVRVKYSSAAFGTNVVANNNIQITRGVINDDPNCYSNVVATDRTSNVFFVPALEAVFSQCKNPILTTPQSIMHVKIKLQNCNTGGTISIEDTTTAFGGLMLLYSAYAEFPNDTFQTYYDAIVANDVVTIPNCGARINSFDPPIITGGTNSMLTIRGQQFGATQGSGNISFKNANNGGISYLPLEPIDISLWSDTLITVIVPSIDTGSYPQPIGSGNFIIENASGEKDTTNTDLTILYSIQNGRKDTNNISKVPYIHFDQSGATGGYRFYVDTSISHNPAAYGCVRKAMNDWICATGINFSIVGDTFGISTTVALADGVNLIAFGSSPSATTGITTLFTRHCSTSLDVLPIFGIDIFLGSAYTSSYWYDSTGTLPVPATKADFYHIILHEFGHAVAQNHVNDPHAIMWYTTYLGAPIPANNRWVDLSADQSGFNGGNYQVSNSISPTTTLNCGLIKMTELHQCISAIKTIKGDDLLIKFFPNPFSDKVMLNIEGYYSEPLEFELFNMEGSKISSWSFVSHEKEASLNMPENLASGVYLLGIIYEGKRQVQKLVHIQN
jgi:hypothetical protein